jgi:hypothetical protein
LGGTLRQPLRGLHHFIEDGNKSRLHDPRGMAKFKLTLLSSSMATRLVEPAGSDTIWSCRELRGPGDSTMPCGGEPESEIRTDRHEKFDYR